jgi:hypothetical protein
LIRGTGYQLAIMTLTQDTCGIIYVKHFVAEKNIQNSAVTRMTPTPWHYIASPA